MEAMVSNSNENAFQTEVLITLPSPVRLKRIPPNCKESIAEIACTIDNPLKNGATVSVYVKFSSWLDHHFGLIIIAENRIFGAGCG